MKLFTDLLAWPVLIWPALALLFPLTGLPGQSLGYGPDRNIYIPPVPLRAHGPLKSLFRPCSR